MNEVELGMTSYDDDAIHLEYQSAVRASAGEEIESWKRS